MAYSKALLLLFIAITSVAAERIIETSDAVAQDLLDNILINYNKNVQPPGNNDIDAPVLVTSSIYILDIEKVDDHSEMFKAHFYFRQKWNDTRLRFDNRETKVKLIYVKEPERVWRPDLFFANEREGKTHHIVAPNVFMKLDSSGSILYSVRLTVTFACRMDLRKFPFDSQQCFFNTESYGYNTERIDLAWDHSYGFAAVSFDNNISLREFDLLDVVPDIDSVTMRKITYRRLNLLFHFQRKTSFYVIRLFIPFVILTVLSWITFWINPKIISLRLTLLLAVLYLMIEIGRDTNVNFITATSYTKGSDVWIAVCESMVFGCLLEFVLVSLLAKKDKSFKLHKEFLDKPSDVEATKHTVIDNDSLTSATKFIAKTLSRRKQWANRIDLISKFLFPTIYACFNIGFWYSYCT